MIYAIAKDRYTKCNSRHSLGPSFSIKHREKLSKEVGREEGSSESGEETSSLPLDSPPAIQICAFMCESALWPKAKDNFRRFSSIINGYVLILLVFNILFF